MRWLTEMGVFAKVVEAGNYATAARQLGWTRSAVSKQVTRLEAGLGVKLLHRSTRAMSLTEAGRSVYEQCARLAEAAEEAVAVAGRLSSAPRGWLKVSASVAFGHAALVPACAGLLARYPELRIDLAMLDRNVDLAEEGFDLVLRFTDAPPEGLAARHLARIEFVLCASPDYIARHGQPTTPADLAGHNCLRQGHPQPLQVWTFEDEAGGAAKVRIDGNLIASGSEAVRDLALDGLGCALLPDYMVRAALADGRLVRLLPAYRPRGAFANLYALYLPSRQGNPKVRAFIDWLVETLKPDAD